MAVTPWVTPNGRFGGLLFLFAAALDALDEECHTSIREPEASFRLRRSWNGREFRKRSLKTAITQEFMREYTWITAEERQHYGYDECIAQIDRLVYPEQYGVQGYPALPYLSSDGRLMVYAPVPSLGPDSIVIRLLVLPLHCQG